ncbi:MAG: hypothetical protein MSS14_11825, partial [Mediterraneibacter faecis]|nr:hypothetical protein [Mediterraneibacter faecis]
TRSDLNLALKFLLCLDMIMDPFFHTGLSISDSLKTVRKSVLIYETIIGLGYPISIEGAATKYWREDILVQRRISPEITTSTVIAWRRNIPYSLAVRKMIEEINAFQA